MYFDINYILFDKLNILHEYDQNSISKSETSIVTDSEAKGECITMSLRSYSALNFDKFKIFFEIILSSFKNLFHRLNKI